MACIHQRKAADWDGYDILVFVQYKNGVLKVPDFCKSKDGVCTQNTDCVSNLCPPTLQYCVDPLPSGNRVQYLAKDACDVGGTSQHVAPESAKHYVSCCSTVGDWVGRNGAALGLVCSGSRNHQDAMNFCARAPDGTLCTGDNVARACGYGCNYNYHKVWTNMEVPWNFMTVYETVVPPSTMEGLYKTCGLWIGAAATTKCTEFKFAPLRLCEASLNLETV